MRVLAYLLAVLVAVGGGGYALIQFASADAAAFRVDGPRLHVSGNLTLLSTERIDILIEENPNLTTVVLGEIDRASDPVALIQKGGLIRSLGLNTAVGPDVALGGDAVYLFLGGVERRLADGATLVVSDWQSDVGPASALAADHPAHTQRRGHVIAMLGDGAFYDFAIAAAPIGGAYVVTDRDLETFGLAERF